MEKLTWIKFENTVQNVQNDFEDFCRVFFKCFLFGRDSRDENDDDTSIQALLK